MKCTAVRFLSTFRTLAARISDAVLIRSGVRYPLAHCVFRLIERTMRERSSLDSLLESTCRHAIHTGAHVDRSDDI